MKHQISNIKKPIIALATAIITLGLFGCDDYSDANSKYSFIRPSTKDVVTKVEHYYEDYVGKQNYDKDTHYTTIDYRIYGTCNNRQYFKIELPNADGEYYENYEYADMHTGLIYTSINYDILKLGTQGEPLVYNPKIVQEIAEGKHLDYRYLKQDFPEVAEKYNVTEEPSGEVNSIAQENNAKASMDASVSHIPVTVPHIQ